MTTACDTDTQTIRVAAGEVEYTWPEVLTETSGADISGDTVQMCLGSYTAPGAFVTPDRVDHPAVSSVSVALLIGVDYRPAAGTYWVWVKITDAPEVPLRRGHRVIIDAAGPIVVPPQPGGGPGINGGPPVTFDITDDGNFMPSGGGPDGSWYFD